MWLEYEHKIDEDWTINNLRLIAEYDSIGSAWYGVKEALIWDFVEVDQKNRSKNQINLGNDILYNMFDYGIEYIKKITTKEQRACNSLSVIDSSI